MRFLDIKAFIKTPNSYFSTLHRAMLKKGRHLIRNTSKNTETNESTMPEVFVEPNLVYCFGFNLRKAAFVKKYFPLKQFVFVSTQAKVGELSKIKKEIQAIKGAVAIWVWGTKVPDIIKPLLKNNRRIVSYVEDGFISVSGHDANNDVMPLSLAIDKMANHYESAKFTDIESILTNYDFTNDLPLLERACSLRDKMVADYIGKHSAFSLINDYNYSSERNVILVVGQPESQQSAKSATDNYELLKLAKKEHPDSIIIYKPFDVELVSFDQDVKKFIFDSKIDILDDKISLLLLLKKVKHVYVVKSLIGLDALIRDVKVTTTGCPFYAGWGLTDDRANVPRRKRQLTIEQLVAGTYILYLKYFDPVSGQAISPEDAVASILAMRKSVKADSLVKENSKNISAAKAYLEKIEQAEIKKSAQKATPKVITPPKKEVKSAVAPAKGKDNQTPSSAIPDWYNTTPGLELKASLKSDKNIFLFIPWIAEHSQSLISKLDGGESYSLVALDLVSGLQNDDIRRAVSRFSRENPAIYRQMVVRRLAPLRNKIRGVVFTFDWAAPMRIISSVCLELGIPRILIPHESVFADRNKYYWDVTGQASLPAADVILGWGSLQKEIFVERGYPAERFHIVGAPKFDSYYNYQAYLEREQFCQLHGLDPDKKIILFAAQPLDSQMDQAQARASQRSAIQDLILYTAEHNLQLLIRTPPSKDAIINMALRQLMDKHGHVAVDNALCYMLSAEETLFHCDAITSINSTMLFEGALLGKPVFSMKYIEFTQLWERVGIPAVRSYAELAQLLQGVQANNWQAMSLDFTWAADALGVGEFDGQATQRITRYLADFAKSMPDSFSFNKPLDSLFSGKALDVIAIPSAEKTLATVQCYLQKQLQARTMVSTHGKIELPKLCSVDIFFQWGITPNENKIRQAKLARSFGKPVVIVEDGFIRSLDIGLSGEPGLSIILDDKTAYYDATKESRLSYLLEHGRVLTAVEEQRALAAMEQIVSNKISKYNHAPILPVEIGEPGRKKVLLVDQRFGDQSVTSGLADENSFHRMLMDAINNNPDCDIIIKQHPDAIKGGKSSYFSNERVAFTQNMPNVHLVNYDINPYSLLALVDEVYVVTSGMGFEALMAGKKVHCYGMPFYAGWGVTNDQISLASRTRNRHITDLFFFSYIELSRYFLPSSGEESEIEDVIAYFVQQQKLSDV